MKAKNATILFVSGTECGDDHWLNRWADKLSTGQRVTIEPDQSSMELAGLVQNADGPCVLVGHGRGVRACVSALRDDAQAEGRVAGAFFVAPEVIGAEDEADYGREPLPCPSIVVASRSADASPFDTIEDLAGAWGSLLVDAGEVGNLDAASGHGPWPEGSLTFARFVSRLPS